MLERSFFLPIRILVVKPGDWALVLEEALLTVGCVALSPLLTLVSCLRATFWGRAWLENVPNYEWA